MKRIRTNILKFIVLVFTMINLSFIPAVNAIDRCGSFEVVDNPGFASNIAALADGTAWAMGLSPGASFTPALYYFDGISWSDYPSPSEIDGFVFGASGTTPDGDAWFAGTRAYSVYEIEIAFIRMRNGSIDQIDKMLYSGGAPIDISASTATEVWALTASGNILRFDGLSWDTIDVPQPFSPQRSIHPAGIYVSNSNDVWITGSGGPGRADYFGYVQHWDGSQWDLVTTPYTGQDLSFFEDIDASGPNDIWISGHWGYSEDILLHWDGSSWEKSQGPLKPMDEILVMGEGNAWAFPYSLTEGNIFFYWNGIQWSEGSQLTLDTAKTINWQDVSKAGECDAWAVGFYHDLNLVKHPVTARLRPGVIQPPQEPQRVVSVTAIDVSRTQVSRKSYSGIASVSVTDQNQEPLAGAVVHGYFSGPSNENVSATTDHNGIANFTSSVVSRPSGNWCFSVTGMKSSLGIYNADLNIETSDCEANDPDGGGGKRGGKQR